MDEVAANLNRTMEQQQKNDDGNGGGGGGRSAEVVRCDTFLPQVELTILLVEPDHSTRHIISALLRKCSYRVVTVSNGLKAWEALKSKGPEIDLILTELELPEISGFALLSMIMEHDVCKNIPVIMMSSQDSVSMVLKCMLKGAADFLIKPVRKNELTNLWQHVWRRKAVSSVPQNTAFPQACNQSGGTVNSSKKNSECSEKLSEGKDPSQLNISSKSSNVDVEKHEKFTKFERESTKHDDETEEKSVMFASETARCNRTSKSTYLKLEQDDDSAEFENQDKIFRDELSKDNPNIDTEIHGWSHELVEPSRGDINFIATVENPPKHKSENCCLDGGNMTKFDSDTQLKLSLRRDFPDSSCEKQSEATGEWQRLNHSNASAFSRYNGSKLLQSPFSTPLVTSAKVNANCDSHKSYKLAAITADNSCLNGGSNQSQENMITNVYNSVFHAQSAVHPIWKPKPVCQKESSPFPSSISSQSNQSHNSSQNNYCPDDANFTSLNQNVHDEINMDHTRHDFPAMSQCANDLCPDTANHINSSTYGSGDDGNSTSAVVSKNNPESFSDGGSESFSNGGCYTHGGFRLIDAHRSSHREAALTKYLLKRKERCYVKKVRYQSRKKFAEQRPRVKGQFVCQVSDDNPATDAGGDS
ncbi:two-component response regulator-like APRR3 isoform X2 [Lotus japonicus]|uniref:two-component response regulator-like APRR3 isoform X2 n=1 Tax=Lotus japonicus TaxID=34305 RepID=UPI00258E35C6|nr:two-component response regulator-like APRR3 isoform X2 [Lotus japonicus]